MTQIRTVGVVGLGTMGAGIVEVCARHGFSVHAVETSEEGISRGLAKIEASTARAVAAGKLTAEAQADLLERVQVSTDLQSLAHADIVIEAVPENLDLKRGVLSALDAVVPQHCILATNTSSLSVTEISVSTKRPERVVGVHFFNPAPVLAFIEIVRTVVTNEDVVQEVLGFAESLGKEPVVVGDRAGFIANSLLFGYLNHAASLYEQRYASREDIDAAMRLGCGYPMGPLALLDLIGVDTAYAILDQMYHQSRDRLHAPRSILKQMVTAGLLGRKTGRGFYTYEGPGSPVIVTDEESKVSEREGDVLPITRVGVVGTGTMATGIIEVFARAGFDVTFAARSADKVASVHAAIEKSQAKAVDRGKLDADEAQKTAERITGTTDLADLADVDLVVEAVVEDLDVKRELFGKLDSIVRADAMFATTTSSLPVIDLAMATSRPERLAGLHFFNPAPVMKLVEVVHTVSTAPEVQKTFVDLCFRLGKHPVSCGDRAGFIVNALLFPYLNDAVSMHEANYSTIDDIDLAMKRGCGLPMGPFELLDVVGLDVSLAIQQSLYLEFREPGFAPAPMLEHLVTAGYLGRKTGRGFRVHA
jgi:3-hydroxybutyryl-CoA dehydrogenase